MIKRILRAAIARLAGTGPTKDTTGTLTSIAQLMCDDPVLWESARKKAAGGSKILIATNVPAFHHVSLLESAIAVALTLRGAEVHLLVCDKTLPGCLRAAQDNVPSPSSFANYELPELICSQCQLMGEQTLGTLGLKTHRLGDLVTGAEREEAKSISQSLPLRDIPSWKLDGLAVGEHAYAGCLRYFARGDIEQVEGSDIVLRRYLEASLLTVYAMRRLTERESFSGSCFHHGIYVPQGLVGEVLRARGVPVVNWNPAYRQNTFIFSHGDSYHHTMLSEDVMSWRDMPWTPEMDAEIMSYLKSRWYGTRDWIWFHEKPDEDFDVYADKVGIDRQRPIIGLLTNVMWDAQLHFSANAFSGMLEWVLESIRFFAARPDLQLLIRIHPAEIRGTAPSRQPLLAEIQKAFPSLPANIFIVGPESPVSTYAAMERCDSVLIYGTKTGVELTSMGIPVIVGGEAWIRNKGLTLDASTPEEYFDHLARLPLGARMDRKTTEMARKYAYHFFFRRMIPLPFIVPQDNKIYQLAVPGLSALGKGHYPGLDIVCDGILKGVPFIYPAEYLGLHDRETASAI